MHAALPHDAIQSVEMLRNDPDARPVTRALTVLAFPLAIASALLAAPAIETEARLRPLLRATRTKTFAS